MSKFFDYNGPVDKTVTHVIDDTYTEKEIIDQEDDLSFKKLIHNIPMNYNGSFVVVKEWSTYKLLICENHVDLYHMQPIGGGRVSSYGGVQMIHSSSSNFGPYNKRVIDRLCSDFEVKLPTVFCVNGKMQALRVQFPNAIISTKHFSDTIVGDWEIVSQKFYHGLEQRAYYGVKKFSYTHHHCDLCSIVEESAGRLGVDQEVIRDMFISSGGYTCKPSKMVKKRYIKGAVIAMAKSWMVRSDVVRYISDRFKVHESLVETIIDALIHHEVIVVIGVSAGVSRLALRCIDHQSHMATFPSNMEKKLKTIAIEYKVGRITGRYAVAIDTDISDYMYVGSDYDPLASVVYVEGPTSYVMIQYEKSHYTRCHGKIQVFVKQEFKPQEEYRYKWSFLNRMKDTKSNFFIHLSDYSHKVLPSVHIKERDREMHWNQFTFQFDIGGKYFKIVDRKRHHIFEYKNERNFIRASVRLLEKYGVQKYGELLIGDQIDDGQEWFPDEDEKRWADFLALGREVEYNDVPFPQYGTFIDYNRSKDPRGLYRTLQLRWHPDRWSGIKMKLGDKDRILARVLEIAKMVSSSRVDE